MQYYLLLPKDTEEDALNEANLLGESSFGVFWAGSGLRALMRIVETEPEMLTHCNIVTDIGKKLSLEEFLDALNKLEIRRSI